MRKFFVTSLLLCGLQSYLYAQEPQVYSQFFMNPYVYNPAYAGVEGHSAVFTLYRKQWVSINGAPEIGHIAFHTPLKGSLSFGALAFNDRNAFFKTSGIKGTLGYIAAFDKKHYIRFGLSLGAGTSALDDQNIDAVFNDVAFANLLGSSSFMIADFGVAYHFDHFNIGFAIPNLIGREVLSEDSFSKISLSPTDNMLLKINYRGHITHDFAVEPHLLYRFSAVGASQYEAAAIFHIKHIVWVGGSFRQDVGAVGLFGFKVKEKIGVGYSYELGNSKISSLTGATHEIHIGIHLGSKKKHHKHSHSFIKSHKLTPEERAKLAEKKRQERLQALQDARPSVEEATEEPIDNPQVEEEPVDVAPIDKTDPDPVEIENNSETETDNTENDPISSENNNDNININDNNTNTVPIVADIKPTVTSQNPNTVKRGNHFIELPHGHHVIAGAFKEFQHAEDYSDELFQRGFHDALVGYVTAKGLYYTVVFRSDKYTTAESQKEKIKTMKGMDKVWVLTVE